MGIPSRKASLPFIYESRKTRHLSQVREWEYTNSRGSCQLFGGYTRQSFGFPPKVELIRGMQTALPEMPDIAGEAFIPIGTADFHIIHNCCYVASWASASLVPAVLFPLAENSFLYITLSLLSNKALYRFLPWI